MARSPFTLAASVTSALPHAGVVGAAVLTEGAAGRYDSAVADLTDGRRVVVRAPADAEAGVELASEVRALRALTPGVRGLLPFRAPRLLGETGLDGARVVVVDFLPGYRVDAAHLPSGRGAASSIGEALAALHSLPPSVVRDEGLPVRTAAQVRDDAVRLVDRAEATHHLPATLAARWRRALGTERLWQFDSAVILGGAGAASFVFEDTDGAPHVTGMLHWHGLSIGDPATDLQWLAAAPAAADDVYLTYTDVSRRAPDALLRERARLYAELEFAKWLVHGHESGRDDIVDDAVALLASLAEGTAGDDLVTDGFLGVDDAIALLASMPEAPAREADTAMQTDAYDPNELSLWITDTNDEDDEDAPDEDTREEAESAQPTDQPGQELRPQPKALTPEEAEAEASRAADAAMRRWMGATG